MIDVSGLPVLDVHAHPFLNKGAVSAEEFTDITSFGGGYGGSTDGSRNYMEAGGVTWTPEVSDEIQRIKRSTLYFTRMVNDLATFLDTSPDIESVLNERNAQVAVDYRDYTRRLWADAGLDTVIFDFGVPLPMLDIDEVSAELPIEVVPIYRIEPLIADLLKQDLTWAEFKDAYDTAISEGLSSGRYRGVKSIIAYRTGLDVSPLSRTPDQGFQALDAIKRGLGGGSMKKLRDHLLCRAIELCMEYDVPMQIHTGMGDVEVNLVMCRPSYLLDLLRFPTYRGCRVLLVHTGYPYHREAAYMANVLPRTFLDISEGIPFASSAAWEIIEGVVSMAPLNKICYGSDGYQVPEIMYTSAKLGKQALQDVMNGLVARGMLVEADAQKAAAGILSDNARELYKLD
jgi:predicted TIM-barrel fold metal-dependent hydrolase